MPRRRKDPVREQAALARRAQILEAAARTFAERGFHRTTIRDIARAADIGDGTIYHYFPNKTALLLGLLHQLNTTDERPQAFEQAVQSDPLTFMEAYLRQRLSVLAPAGLEIFQALLPELLTDAALRERYQAEVIAPTYAAAEAAFTQMHAAGTVHLPDVALGTRLMSATLLGLLVQRALGDPVLKARWNELPEAIADVQWNGLRPRDEEDAR
jgi:TetR/AcrR family transcriptional regulator, fatty acid metabolism regulator protein